MLGSACPAGLCALSIHNDNGYLAYPGSATIGEVQVFDTMNLVRPLLYRVPLTSGPALCPKHRGVASIRSSLGGQGGFHCRHPGGGTGLGSLCLQISACAPTARSPWPCGYLGEWEEPQRAAFPQLPPPHPVIPEPVVFVLNRLGF